MPRKRKRGARRASGADTPCFSRLRARLCARESPPPLTRAFGAVRDQDHSRSEHHGPQLAAYLQLRGGAALSKWKRQSTNKSISRTAMIPDDTAVQQTRARGLGPAGPTWDSHGPPVAARQSRAWICSTGATRRAHWRLVSFARFN
jgi:hypothetical protein